MNLHRLGRIGIVVLLLGSIAGWVFGEVSVELDKKGRYRDLIILQGMEGKTPIVWRQVREGIDPRLTLNPHGDEVGDLSPSVRENPRTGLPWAVWSLNDGNDYELAFSLFNGQQWVVTRPLEERDNRFHDLDPVLEFTSGGIPVVVWWRASPVSQVFLTFQIGGRWVSSIPVSDPAVDSRHPRLQVRGNEILISYEITSGDQAISQSTSYSLMGDPPPPDCPPEEMNCDISDGPDVDGSSNKRPKKKQ